MTERTVMWLAFNVLVVVLLAIDLGLNRKSHEVLPQNLWVSGSSPVIAYGSDRFKTARLASRLNLEMEEAEMLMKKRQKARDRFTRDFLNRDDHDSDLYDILLNNDRSNPEKIAQTIAGYVAPH
jgi:hypothetical protein